METFSVSAGQSRDRELAQGPPKRLDRLIISDYIGLVRRKEGEYPEALVAFKKAVNLQPKTTLYCLNAARKAAKTRA